MNYYKVIMNQKLNVAGKRLNF